MATKKAPSKATSAKKSVATKSASAPKVSKKKLTFGEKAAALKPGALIAELLGTFVLAGAVINLSGGGTISSVAIALVLAILVVVFGAISGGHLNPAITIAQYVNKKIDGVKATSYIVAQVIGAVLALGVLTGIANANWDFNAAVQAGVEKAGITSETIEKAGGLEKWAATYGGVESVASQLGIENKAPSVYKAAKMTDGKEWGVMLAEVVGAIIFGLGVGYAVFARNKSQIEAGLAVGIALFAGLAVGGSAVILNPAVAGAVSALQWANPFGADAGTFWWPVFTYIFATVIGMTAGFTTYRFISKDTSEK
jgi:glycerol uptake facilitator-like aquaporin